jgi:hypothetical protein
VLRLESDRDGVRGLELGSGLKGWKVRVRGLGLGVRVLGLRF